MTEQEAFQKSRDLLSELMERSELQLDLAYTALLFNDRAIAEDVLELHDKIEHMSVEFDETVLGLAGKMDHPRKLWSLLRTTDSVKIIADCAAALAQLVMDGLPTHPLLRAIFESSDETVVRVTVEENSSIDQKSLADVRLQDLTGMRVTCIKRGDGWLHGPPSNTVVNGGDVLFLRGPVEGQHILKSLITASE
ncbi:MAG: potassium channel family protein [Candidatus Bathyarchaeia archaeon]